MADTKISDLTAITGANTAADDDFVVVDTSAAQTKRITRDELKSAIGGATDINGLSDATTNSSGKTIGIGTDALANDDGSSNLNTALGYKAGEDITTGTHGLFLGYNAGLNVTASGTIAVGSLAMGSGVTTGNYNTGIGYQAGYDLTSGTFNVFTGYQAGANVTTGRGNVFQGTETGEFATTANYGIAIGYEAIGVGIMTGTDNTAIGKQAGRDLTIGEYNNFMGYNAGFNATTGSSNIAIGRSAVGLGVLTGTSNVAVGYSAGYDLTSGNYNVMVGFVAGGNVSTGADNTILGANAAISLTTGSNNTIIGHDAAPTSATVSNEITLGNASITDVRIPGVGFYIDNGDVTVGGGSIQLKGITYTDFSDYWGVGDNKALFTPYGYLGSNGSFAVSLFSNGYRNSSGGFTSMGLNGQSTASGIELNPTGVIQFRTGTPSGSSVPESVRIDSMGNVGIGTTATVGSNSTGQGFWFDENEAARFSRASNACSILNRITTTGPIQLIRYNGSGVGSISVTASATAYNTSSDYRLKENVVGLGDAIDRVKLLNPSRFNFIADPDTTVDGFVAHEVSDIVPEAVTGTKDAMRDEEYEVTPAVLDEDGNEVTPAVIGTRSVPDYQGIDQSKLVPLLTAALQEALTEINDLKARVTALEG
jgi:hypothetical protein